LIPGEFSFSDQHSSRDGSKELGVRPNWAKCRSRKRQFFFKIAVPVPFGKHKLVVNDNPDSHSRSIPVGHYFFHKGIDKKILLQLGIPAVLFVARGAFLTTFINQKKLELAMNIMLLALSIYLVFNINKKLKMSNKNLVIGGVASGFLAGLVGTGGAIRGLVLASFSLEKNVFLATSALIDLGVDSTRAVIYINNGFFKKEFLITIPFLIAVSILGTWIGKRILAHVNEVLFRYIVILTIIATAIFQTVNYFK
jgi:uncharacterized membrane protein YfcA